MESTTPVNWEALDALITDFVKSEQNGHIDASFDLLRSYAPFILNDRRFLFRLQKQKFIELLRKGTIEDHGLAVNCLRKVLAPSALDAYPEAYEEFKHVLLAFIYDKNDPTSPVANEWAEKRRFDLAGLLSSVLRAHLHAYDPVFSMTLNYLIGIHKRYCLRQGICSPISNLTERLLLEERDPPAIPQESSYEAPPFDEVDVQALAHAVELTRQGAVDSLRFAKGDLFQAFQNELCRMRLNVPMLDELVHEYCVYRGIVDSGFATPSVSETQPSDVNKPSDGESSICNTQNGSPESSAGMTGTLATNAVVRYVGESICNLEDCSTSGSHQHGNSGVLQRNRSGERNKRKRWMGRQDELDIPDNSFPVCSKRELISNTLIANTNIAKEHKGSGKHYTLDINSEEDKHELVLWMKDLACRGMAAEVVEEVNALDPNFFAQNPTLLFQLKQVEFLKLVSSGDHSGALKVASSHLGPLAAGDPTLLKPLKETLLTLLQPNEKELDRSLPLHALATSLQVAIGRKLGIEEPQLIKIVRATLHTHNEWFKLHMCKDNFESLLRIDSLRGGNITLLSPAALSKSNMDSSTHGSSQVTVSSSVRTPEDSTSPTQVSSGDLGCDENAILKVMEFLALPRADAIHLLAQYNNDAETVIQQIFA
ncbi:hypothetical protein ACFE04_021939 [Oxalis oulophora]